MIFQLQTNGPPGFLRPYMTDDGRDANISFFYPNHKGDTIMRAVATSEDFIERHPVGEVIVRLDKDKAAQDAPIWSPAKLTDIFYYMLDPLLPARHHTLNVRVRGADEVYKPYEVKSAKAGRAPDVDRRVQEGRAREL